MMMPVMMRPTANTHVITSGAPFNLLMIQRARGSPATQAWCVGLGGTRVNNGPMRWERLRVLGACGVAVGTRADGCDMRAPLVNGPDQTAMTIPMLRTALKPNSANDKANATLQTRMERDGGPDLIPAWPRKTRRSVRRRRSPNQRRPMRADLQPEATTYNKAANTKASCSRYRRRSRCLPTHHHG